jgi:hypothetical protein
MSLKDEPQIAGGDGWNSLGQEISFEYPCTSHKKVLARIPKGIRARMERIKFKGE